MTGTGPLNSQQKRFLRGLGHHLESSVLVGREGLSNALIESCRDVLRARELIKVKLGQNCPLDRKEGSRMLAERTGSHLVQLIGKTFLLYRPNPDLPPEQSIQLPS